MKKNGNHASTNQSLDLGQWKDGLLLLMFAVVESPIPDKSIFRVSNLRWTH